MAVNTSTIATAYDAQTETDWMELIPETGGDYRKRPEVALLNGPPVARHKTNERGRGIVGRLGKGRKDGA